MADQSEHTQHPGARILNVAAAAERSENNHNNNHNNRNHNHNHSYEGSGNEDVGILSVAAAAQAVALQLVEGRGEKEGDGSGQEGPSQKPKRLCRYPGCKRVIKSQGHCQRHGAKAKRCRIEGCNKQAQGTHDGMCKRHWKAIHFPEVKSNAENEPPQPKGESVYDSVLPQSIAYRPSVVTGKYKEGDEDSSGHELPVVPPPVQPAAAAAAAVYPVDDIKTDPWDCPPPPEGVSVMPLVAFLREGGTEEAGWHRNNERLARGMFPVASLSCQLEPWERQLALVEILLLSGGTPYANFKDLAHAWGRDKGFHHTLANAICERRGAVERKRRSDAGKRLTPEEREHFRQKLKKARTAEESSSSLPEGDDGPDGDGGDDGMENENMVQQQVRKYVRDLDIPTEHVHI